MGTMNTKTKKRWGSVIGILGTGVFLFSAVLITAFVYFYFAEERDPWNLFCAGLFGLMAICGLLVVHAGMRIHDGDYKESDAPRFLDRWVRNTLFLGMLAVFASAALLVIGETAAKTGSLEGIWVQMLLSIAAAVSGVILYVQRMMREMKKRRRVRRLAEEAVLNASGRFSMVIDEVYRRNDNGQFFYVGQVKGQIHTGDRVLVYLPGGKPYEAQVNGIRLNGKNVRRVNSASAGLYLSAEDDTRAFPEFSVICGTCEPKDIPGENHLELPALCGWLRGYDDHAGNDTYINILINAILRSRFLVPVFLYETEMADPSVILPEDAAYEYPTVSASALPQSMVLPVYTDWDALGRWRNLYDPDRLEGTQILSFDEITDKVAQEYTGFVIDPFGPKPFYLSREMLAGINVQTETSENIQEEEAQ